MIEQIALSANDIHLWLSFYQEATDPALLAGMGSLMNEVERGREARYRFADERFRYRVTRALVRTVLSRYAPVAPSDWRFATSEYGRPRIDDSHGAASDIEFNLSHTVGLIVLAVTRHRQLGVDVETFAGRDVTAGVAQRFFAAAEAQALARTGPEAHQQRFFEYWTLKESYIKARGMGLSLPLDQFGFTFSQAGRTAMQCEAGFADDGANWDFWQWRPTPHHLLALCAGRHKGPSRITAQRVIPTQAAQALHLPLLRASTNDGSPT